MQIDAEKLATQGLRLDLGTDERRRLLELGPSGAVTGTYELVEGRHRICAGASHALALTNLEWDVGDVRIVLTSHGKLERLTVDLQVTAGAGAKGTISCSDLSAAVIEIWHPRLGSGPVELRGVRAKRVHLDLDGRKAQVRMAGLEMDEATLSLPTGTLRLEGLALPAGLRASREGWEAKTVRLGALTVKAPDLGAMLTRRPRQTKASGAAPKLDLRLLDRISGRVSLDVTIDAAIRAIGMRKATHRFRVPIRGGSLNFKTLEKGLARLEDSILDFAVDDGKLQLVKDIPLVPFDRKTLVYWELDREDQALASHNRVRLRRLLDYRIPADDGPRKRSKGPAVRLDKVACDEIDVTLDLRGPNVLELAGGRVTLGDARRKAVGRATVAGSLLYRPGKSTQSTELVASLERLRGAVEGISLGRWSVSCTRAQIAAIAPVRIALEGLRPRSVMTTIGDVRLAGLRITAAS